MDEENIETNEAEDSAGQEAAALAQAKTEMENRARRMGWRPKEEFRGDSSRWTDAETFVQRGETELPVLRERYRALDDRFVEAEAKAAERTQALETRLRDMGQTFQEFRDFAKRAEERSYRRAKAEIEARMALAVETADRNAYSAARSEMEQLETARTEINTTPENKRAADPPKEPDKPKDSAEQGKWHPDAIAWAQDNSWFGDKGDPKMSNYAIASYAQLQKDNPGWAVKDILAEVKKDVMERFPEKFENKRRSDSPATITSESNPPPPAKKKGKYPDYRDAPADAKVAFDRFKKQIPDYKWEEYAKLYFTEGE